MRESNGQAGEMSAAIDLAQAIVDEIRRENERVRANEEGIEIVIFGSLDELIIDGTVNMVRIAQAVVNRLSYNSDKSRVDYGSNSG